MEFESEYVDQLTCFVCFVCLIYSPYWFKTSFGVDASINDLSLYLSLLKYRLLDESVADAALSTLHFHLYFLTEELTVFSFFSNKVDEDQKSALACKMLSCVKPKKWEIKKPSTPILSPTVRLIDLVGPKSWLLFNVLGVDSEWLLDPPENWKNILSFQECSEFVRTC